MPAALRLASVLLFASGCASLVFETLWFRRAGLAFGNSVAASALVLSSFMAGMALGNALAARFAARVRRPTRLYAWLELAIGASGVLLVAALPALGPGLAPLFRPFFDTPWLLQTLRFAAGFVVLLVPAIAMGATLPLLIHALRRHGDFGHLLGRLYGWNTLGAMTGALLAEHLLIPLGGIYGAAWAATLLDVLAAAGAFALGRSGGRRPAAASAARAQPTGARARLPVRARRLLLAAAATGAIALAFEVAWFMMLVQFVPNSSAVFASMLAVVLGAIALGSLAGARLSRRLPSWHQRASELALLVPVLAALSHASLALWMSPLIDAFEAAGLYGAIQIGALATALISVSLMGPVAFASGLLFTAIGRALEQEIGGAARSAGLLTLANSAGAAVGPLVAGFAMLPRLGVETSAQWLAGSYLLVAWWLRPLRVRTRGALARTALAAALGLAALLAYPNGSLRATLERLVAAEYGDDEEVVALREGIVETAIVTRARWHGQTLWYRLITDGYTMSGGSIDARRYMRLFANLPAALHPGIRDALLISFGVGNTASALTGLAELERLDIVDISPEILELAETIRETPDADPLHDPRVHVHIEDGRYFLQTRRRRYDLITGEPPPPAFAGVVNLYTREYFALMRARLKEGGIASYWLPVSQMRPVDSQAITRSWCEVFDDCTLWEATPGDWILLGSRPPADATLTPVTARRFGAQWRDHAGATRLHEIGFDRPEQLASIFLADAPFLRSWSRAVAPLVDDHPERAPAVVGSWEALPPEFTWIRDTAATRDRFARSDWTAEHWPPSLREASARTIALQPLVRLALLDAQLPPVARLAAIHRSLDASGMHELALWLLGSDVDRQRAARALAAAGSDAPAVRLELARGALADRRFDEAARLFGRLPEALQPSEVALLHAFSLARAGQPDAARRAARRSGLDRAPEWADAWRAIRTTFRLADPGGATAAPERG